MHDEDIRATLIAAVSHDLRSPLAAAITAVDTLALPATSCAAEDKRALVDVVRIALAQMSRLIDGLLDSSRVQHCADTVCLVRTELAEIVYAALKSIPDACAVVVHMPVELASVVTDPALLERVIANVVGNALRFSPAGTRPQLVVVRSGAWIEMRVVDRGPGVSPERYHQIFQPFIRFDQVGSAPGLGLGLAIARTLAGAIGSEIHAESTPGGGLTMVIAVPYAD
jgi:two-component system sensor histidine kinase KdpD